VKFAYDAFVDIAGAALDFSGSSAAADMGVSHSIIESNGLGIRANTGIKIDDVHFEDNGQDVLNTQGAIIFSSHNTYQHCGSHPQTPSIDLSGSATFFSSYDTSDLKAGCTLYHAPKGAHVYTTGPQFPAATFPEGVLNSGDPAAIAAGVLAPMSSSAKDVKGTVVAQLFRGNLYFLSLRGGPTAIHAEGGATGGARAVGLPPGEQITFRLTSVDGSGATIADGNKGDFPIKGRICSDGLMPGSEQTVVLEVDDEGGMFVKSSSCWQMPQHAARRGNL
jgi:hypothetical protein